MKKLTIAAVLILLAALSYSQEKNEGEKEKLANSIAKESKYYGLIIGINENEDENLSQLEFPISDAKKLYDVLTDKYTFEKDNTTLLQNPTRAELINNLDLLANKIIPDDNLLIFYSGHGLWDKDENEAYWLPSDARQDSTNNWFRYSTLEDYIKEINSRHTLLINDACFSGAIFKARSAFQDKETTLRQLYELPSRKAMTSSNLTVVPDKSPFANFLIQRLYDNEETFMSSEEFFNSFRIDVMNNSETIPQYGEISDTGDQGGNFIFLKSK